VYPLAKVGVAGSNPVVRSRETAGQAGASRPFLTSGIVRKARGPVGSRLVHDLVTGRMKPRGLRDAMDLGTGPGAARPVH
jgi:hypothetical protein